MRGGLGVPLRKSSLVAFCFGVFTTLGLCLLFVSVQDDNFKPLIYLQQKQEHKTRDMYELRGEKTTTSERRRIDDLYQPSMESLQNKSHPGSDAELVNESTAFSSSVASLVSAEILFKPEPTCPPPNQRNIVCIKVHKAASTTAVAILERYGYRNNLTLAVKQEVKYGPHILSSSSTFKRKMVYQWQRKYNMLTNHVRYDRAEMDVVIPNATYLSILRHPVKHFESAFVYFLVAKHLELSRHDPIKAFFENPEEYWKRKFYFWFQLRNGQIFDLGLDHNNHTGSEVAGLIQRLAKEFDLIMIADYFDESLLLLRKHLCLDWKEIVYIPDNFRTEGQKIQLSEEQREQIEIWNWADMELYRFFNQTFWNKVRDYGPEFKNDLLYFKTLLSDTREECTTGRVKRKPRDGHGVRTLELKTNATEFCRELLLGDTDYTKMFRNRQKETLYNRPIFWD